MSTIDTHQVIEEMIEAGVGKRQAEIITRAIRQNEHNLVTKNDLHLECKFIRSEISEVRSELKGEIAEVRNEVKWLKGLMFVLLGLVGSLWFK